MRVMSSVRRKVAAVTGAGSGIGRALGLELARRDATLALCDVDPVGLAQTVEQVSATGAEVSGQALDVTDRDAVWPTPSCSATERRTRSTTTRASPCTAACSTATGPTTSGCSV
jgi:NAD(P)-dependent dehydrogenase (short-subunit alcohol dehydrogenase family)